MAPGHGLLKARATPTAMPLPMRGARRSQGQQSQDGGKERPQTLPFLQPELDVIRAAKGTILQLFAHHLVLLQQVEGFLVVGFVDQHVDARQVADETAHDVGRVFVVDDGGDSLVVQRSLYEVGAKSVVARDESERSFHGCFVRGFLPHTLL